MGKDSGVLCLISPFLEKSHIVTTYISSDTAAVLWGKARVRFRGRGRW
jgi:hypothetical protein